MRTRLNQFITPKPIDPLQADLATLESLSTEFVEHIDFINTAMAVGDVSTYSQENLVAIESVFIQYEADNGFEIATEGLGERIIENIRKAWARLMELLASICAYIKKIFFGQNSRQKAVIASVEKTVVEAKKAKAEILRLGHEPDHKPDSNADGGKQKMPSHLVTSGYDGSHTFKVSIPKCIAAVIMPSPGVFHLHELQKTSIFSTEMLHRFADTMAYGVVELTNVCRRAGTGSVMNSVIEGTAWLMVDRLTKQYPGFKRKTIERSYDGGSGYLYTSEFKDTKGGLTFFIWEPARTQGQHELEDKEILKNPAENWPGTNMIRYMSYHTSCEWEESESKSDNIDVMVSLDAWEKLLSDAPEFLKAAKTYATAQQSLFDDIERDLRTGFKDIHHLFNKLLSTPDPLTDRAQYSMAINLSHVGDSLVRLNGKFAKIVSHVKEMQTNTIAVLDRIGSRGISAVTGKEQ